LEHLPATNMQKGFSMIKMKKRERRASDETRIIHSDACQKR